MGTIKAYLESHDVKKLAKGTQDLYAHALDHAKNFLDGKSPEWLSESMEYFAEYLERKSLSGTTVQQYLTCTKIFLKWAGHPVDFTYKISNKERKANKKKHLDRWFTEKDIETCLAYDFTKYGPEERLTYRIIVRLLHETGARVGEIAGIRYRDIEDQNMTIFIQGKTEARPVFYSEKTGLLLMSLIHGKKEGILFGGEYGGTNLDAELFPPVNKIKTVITEMLKDLGMKNGSDGRGPHTFRHYTATYLYYVGKMELVDIATLLGDTPETIRTHYLHPTPKMLRERVAKAYGWD